ncbi:hypothetical protein H2198_002325 [Neophaeococcomyces mojaviensis]|uniref:Uncharacterized protein n=1 Tax=Neophaeococcomyces mojaviensis TaxID=3383035 RepID=A0ACC3AEI4_9EURO|nr:hypothetical protein H2198_002325 [Knufia sp. JES_112]
MAQASIKDISRIAVKLGKASDGNALSPKIIPGLFEKSKPGSSKNLSIERLIQSVSLEDLQELEARASRFNPNYTPIDLSAWYRVRLEPSAVSKERSSFDDILKEIRSLVSSLHSADEVESAHLLQPGPPPAVNAADDPRSSNQGYLDPAPAGVDARYAWTLPGGDGTSVGFVDMEQGWNLNHEDLRDNAVVLISGTNNGYYSHGTSVLGEVLMADNTIGGIGIASKSTGRVVSQWQPDGYSTVDAIISAISLMDFGDILLLEAQATDPKPGGVYKWPVEIEDATYDAIRLATALGIVVIEAGCNGSFDLDAYTNIDGKAIFDRSSSDFRDSGAIMVGAGSSSTPHSRLYFSNFGSRIDVYAWGENIDTTATDDSTGTGDDYTAGFNGTSGASPIVSGAAILLQSISSARTGSPSPRFRFSPLELRRMLASGGTASQDPANDRIGVQPDLKTILDKFLNLPGPDAYIRDYIGDRGDPTSGAVSASPDIIVRQSSIADPNARFGVGSGNENNNTLSQDVLAGQDHFVYVRALNRGGSPAANLTVTVYWASPSTLITPDTWNLIGSSTIASLPATNTVAVFDAITWSASAVPGTGHYCFVALIGSDTDPAPSPADFGDWNTYVRFVTNNNNVAWRNFNVINTPPSSGLWHNFDFSVRGAWDGTQPFIFEALGLLPPESKVQLRVPLDMVKRLRINLQDQNQIEGDFAVVPFAAHPVGRAGWQRVGQGTRLDAGVKWTCTFMVQVPEETYKAVGKRWEFAVRQMFERHELGRLTWHFGQGG